MTPTQYASAARVDSLFTQARQAVTPEELAAREGVVFRRQGQEVRGACPLCGAGQGSRSVFACKDDHWRCWACNERGGDVVDLEREIRGGTLMEAARRLVGNDVPSSPARPRPQPRPQPQGPSVADRVALELWREARPFAGTLAETYLRKRGISADVLALAAPNLRFHPNAKHSWSQEQGVWRTAPAMVVQVVTPAGPTGGAHATYLDRTTAAKAKFWNDDGEPLPSKCMWGPQKDADGRPGGAWLIGPEGSGDLVASEGIETGLSVATLGARAGLAHRVLATLALGRLQGAWLRDEDGCIDPHRIEANPEFPALTWPAPADSPWAEVVVAVDRDMSPLKVKSRTGRGKVCTFLLDGEARARICGRLAVAAWKAAGAARARAIAPAPGSDFSDELRRVLARENA